jgi:hypothetical protein
LLGDRSDSAVPAREELAFRAHEREGAGRLVSLDRKPMPKRKILLRAPWTKEDVRDLKAHSKTKTPAVKVAKALKRTEGAVRQKATSIGIGLGHRR